MTITLQRRADLTLEAAKRDRALDVKVDPQARFHHLAEASPSSPP